MSVKINLGCRNVLLPGYYNVDKEEMPLVNAPDGVKFLQFDAMSIDQYFLANSVDEVFMSHVLEHFTYFGVTQILYKIWGILKPGGCLVGAVPDSEEMIQHFKRKLQAGDLRDIDVIHLEIFGALDEGMAQQHKTVWFEEMAKYFLTRQGFFTIEKLDKVLTSGTALDMPYELFFVARANKPASSQVSRVGREDV